MKLENVMHEFKVGLKKIRNLGARSDLEANYWSITTNRAVTVLETPSGFPFKIEDKPGEQTVTLIREYIGDYIKVIVHMPDFSIDVNKEENGDDSDDQNNQDKDNVNDPQSSIRLVVTDTNFRGTTLEYGVIAYPDEFSIDSFCIKYAYTPDEENIYYKGLDYA
ncbi:uncharacterized protein At2g39795, mitochondrial-like [Papaver somniferum]|uniref:uncharacterized protein At2g39795, mitochondrial-like n=1 Tax=Papaver somniferum TaxID=3469 RepID=UPI000E7056B4|nr:uncharacterized protein At2g39795, mitochondrial-like [Papaver somniferum]